jgi:hypothetical protein
MSEVYILLKHQMVYTVECGNRVSYYANRQSNDFCVKYTVALQLIHENATAVRT